MRKLAEICLYFLFLASFLNLLKSVLSNTFLDFNVYYASASYAFHHGNPYTQITGGFLYPPISLLLFYPFLLFPLVLAGKLWTIVSIVSLLVTIWLIIKMYHETNLIIISLLGICVFSYFPVKYTLGMGQINNIILLLIALALYISHKKKREKVSMLYGISLMIKYFPILLLPYLAVTMQWRILSGIALTIAGLLILGFVFFGVNTNVYYLFHVLPSLSTAAHGAYYYNQALSGFLQRDFVHISFSRLNYIRLGISLLFFVSTLWLIIKKKSKTQKNTNLEISLLITLSLLLNSFSWQHHFVLLLIPLFVTFFMMRQQKRSWKYYVILLICYLLTATNVKNPVELPLLLQSHVFYGAVILWCLDMYLLYQLPDKYEKNKIK